MNWTVKPGTHMYYAGLAAQREAGWGFDHGAVLHKHALTCSAYGDAGRTPR